MVELLYKSVEGNGQPGLRQRVEILERTHTGDDRINAEKRGRRMMWASIITSMGTLVGVLYHIVHMG